MRPSFYAEILLKRTSFDDARRAYVEWIVGAARFDKTRDLREAVGIDTRWSMRELHQGSSFVGRHDARVDTRLDGDRFLLRMVHRDAADPSVLWHSVAEIKREGNGARVTHGVARTAAPGTYLVPTTGSPSVLRRMLTWNGHDVEPLDIGDASLLHISADDADATVAHLLLDKSRRSPVVVATPQIDGVGGQVNATVLAIRLAGLARVAACSDDAASRAVTKALLTRGFPRQFATMDGGIRLYYPNLTPEDNPYTHRLWTRGRIESMEGDPVDRIAGEIAESVLRHSVPAGFFRAIENFDLDAARIRVERVIESVRDPADEKQIGALRSDRDLLQAELSTASAKIAELSDRAAQVEADHFSDLCILDAKEQEIDELRDSLHKEQLKSSTLSLAFEDTSAAKGGALLPADQDALRAVANTRPTPEQCLRALELLYHDHVRILPSAFKSSRTAANFRDGHELWRLLTLLVTEYRSKMANERGGDGIAKDVFGKKFAAKESETTMQNERATNERTFVCDGVTYVMWRHLKMGKADTTVDSIRVHFEWLGDQQLVVIGHCGEHLYLLSH